MLVFKYHEVLSRQVGEKTSMLYEADNLKAYLENKKRRRIRKSKINLHSCKNT